ncbi:MAG: bifunctional metallophosphatase/5'-nucleotidase [Bacteroidales bacterium]|nr:bifunctional metallophosphatase/5'-nucleotidase [Bacteroidales bacterium]
MCSRRSALPDGLYTITVCATTDVHGHYFDSTYINPNQTESSLAKVSSYFKEVRVADPDAIFIDNGDNLQGDHAAFYYNYVDTVSTHLLARIMKYMGYSAVVVGNHDVEAGHAVYDRFRSQLELPYLAANTPVVGSRRSAPYFGEYAILNAGAMRVALIGYTNPNIKSWIDPSLYSGYDIAPANLDDVQRLVDKVQRVHKPDAVILSIHAGTGTGEAEDFENPALYLASKLKGVDLVLAGHDHSPVVKVVDNPDRKVAFVNAGRHAASVGLCKITLEYKQGKVVGRGVEPALVPMAQQPSDSEFNEIFYKDYIAVKDFTTQPVCTFEKEFNLADAINGPSAIVDLIHKVQLQSTSAQISISAPLSTNGVIEAGEMTFNDLFKIYPFENQLYTIKMTGRQLLGHLELSYENWINRAGPTYNFDSAMGIDYKVVKSNKFGERVQISALSDGTQFSLDDEYIVAMNSYRAIGGGDLLRDGAGLNVDDPDSYTVAKYPQVRDLLYAYLVGVGTITPEIVGNWQFVE